MNDFEGLLATDYGFKSQQQQQQQQQQQGKSVPMKDDYDPFFGSSSKSTSRARQSHVNYYNSSNNGDGFSDVFGGPPKYNNNNNNNNSDTLPPPLRDAAAAGFTFDFINSSSSSLPKYDKPVYDDDIFDGVPGLKTSSNTVNINDDVFSNSTTPPVFPPKANAFDDLLGTLSSVASQESKRSAETLPMGLDNFDDLLPGFAASSPPFQRKTSEASKFSKSTLDSARLASTMKEEPLVFIASNSPPEVSSQRQFTDPMAMEDIGTFSMPANTNYDVPSSKGLLVNDLDPLDGLGMSMPAFSSEINDRGDDKNFSRKIPSTSDEPADKSSFISSNIQSEWQRQQTSPKIMTGAPTVSYSFDDPVGQTDSPSYEHSGRNVTTSGVDKFTKLEGHLEPSDDVWLTVSEIPLFTQPTSAPPPSRPPPPRPAKLSKDEMSSFASRSARKKINDFSSIPNSTKYFESPKSVPSPMKGSAVSQTEQFDKFAMGRTHTNINEPVDVFSSQYVEANSDAAASAAAMKEAMDKAEAKFRHAKEVRERENAKAARNREAVYQDKYEKVTEDSQERAFREKQERIEFERQQRERDEELREVRRAEEEKERNREIERERQEIDREQRKIERERERAREIENERLKARQAVERATREARERAATDARQKAEKAAVDKVNSEARQRAERAAVQRAQAEARERAAAEAKERATKAAAEARERANIEGKERATRAEVDAQHRAQRAAVDRATAEARQRAANEARERAAAAAKVNTKYNEDNLESFFDLGSRPSSAPKARANSSVHTREGPDVAKRTSVGTSTNMRKASSTTNITDDLNSIFGAVQSSGDFPDVEGESEDRRRARLERYQRTQDRAVKALAEKNQRDLQVQREQAERHRIGETLDAEIKRWAAGKEGNLRALLSTLQYVLWPECGWQPVSLTDLIIGASVKKAYRKATLCIHPDKVQQKGATLQQKYVAEKVFDLLKEAWNKFNSEELF